MSIADIRSAFVEAAAGRLTCSTAEMSYRHDPDAPEAQILRFAGNRADGTPFDVLSDPLPGMTDLQAVARRMAEVLAGEGAAEKEAGA